MGIMESSEGIEIRAEDREIFRTHDTGDIKSLSYTAKWTISISNGQALSFGLTYASKIFSLITVFLLKSTSSGSKPVCFILLK